KEVMLIFNTILLIVFDFYIFFDLRATKIKVKKTKWLAFVWWGYAISLLIGLYLSAKFNIPLTYRSVLLVAFFMTAVSKFIFIIILLLDDIRRGVIWIAKLFSPRKSKSLAGCVEELSEPLPEEPVHGISRSEFLTKSGILVASLPIFPLSWG